MSHPSNNVYCAGPGDPHALDGISRRHRSGDLDTLCPVCAGYGQWNTQIDLVSHRAIRHACPKCDGRGWIETGDEPVPSPTTEQIGRASRRARVCTYVSISVAAFLVKKKD